MRLQIILQNKGFLTIEIMLAFSLMTLFTISVFTLSSSMQKLKIWSLEELYRLQNVLENIDTLSSTSSKYGNNTDLFYTDPLTISHSDYVTAWGRDSCFPRLVFDEDNAEYFPRGISIGSSNRSSDIEVRNSIIYLSADSSSFSSYDLFIIDAKDFESPFIMSSLSTGPGISAIEVAGPYIFAANASTVNQLQIIDIHNRNIPILLAELKLPLPTPTTTAPYATSIFYSRGFVYLGTEKWNGPEFSIIDVSDPLAPKIIGSFETNTLINDIYVREGRAYLASSDRMQMRVLNIKDKSNPTLADSFSPSGWQTQEGKILEYFEGNMGLGRTVGGFNVSLNHEAFIFPTSTAIVSKDISGGVYGMLLRRREIFLLTHNTGYEFQIFDPGLNNKIFEMSLGIPAVKMICDGSNIFFATGNNMGISIIKLYE